MKILLLIIVMSFNFTQAFAEDFSDRLDRFQSCASSDDPIYRKMCFNDLLKKSTSQETPVFKLIQSTCEAQEIQLHPCYRQTIIYLHSMPLPWTENYELNHAELIRSLCNTPNGTAQRFDKAGADDDRYRCWQALTLNPPQLKKIVADKGCFNRTSFVHSVTYGKLAQACEEGLQTYIDNLGGANQIATQQQHSHP